MAGQIQSITNIQRIENTISLDCSSFDEMRGDLSIFTLDLCPVCPDRLLLTIS